MDDILWPNFHFDIDRANSFVWQIKMDKVLINCTIVVQLDCVFFASHSLFSSILNSLQADSKQCHCRCHSEWIFGYSYAFLSAYVLFHAVKQRSSASHSLSHVAFFTCLLLFVIVTCALPNIANGKIEDDKKVYQVGDQAQVECKTGFDIESGATKMIKCESKNRWSILPKCIARKLNYIWIHLFICSHFFMFETDNFHKLAPFVDI